MTTVEFINCKDWKVNPEAFTPFIGRLEKATDCYEGLINVVFVNDHYIHSLNKAYRGKDKPTDVLSFNYLEDGGAKGGAGDLVGEVYISVETSVRQAEEHNHSLQDELNKLFVHGFLHIHGYDHELDEDYEVMHAIEKKVLKK